ncbi:hypothetical protein M413DRAFT_446750 [Hebeloma cylindrosporum]|uniref:Uncharacterized protein n=1 Tax=Hebeloma cylindrosporum TaxID=76867 RepID=A0A0C3C8B7_HEBCY|nr:hypothetical protein M413DRAFT_446750 [Hebeloma cylindrosporum h7]
MVIPSRNLSALQAYGCSGFGILQVDAEIERIRLIEQVTEREGISILSGKCFMFP